VNLSLPFLDLDDAPAPAPGVAGAGASVCEPGHALPPALRPQQPGRPRPATVVDAAPAPSDEPPGLDLALHPAVWRASQIGGGAQPASPSGFAALDAELPGGGWPHGVLTELLLPQPGIGELRLLAPVLRAVSTPAPPPAPAPQAALAVPSGRHRRTGAAGTAAAASPVRAFGTTAPANPPGAARPVDRGPRAAATTPDTGRCVMLFDPPASLSAWALAQCGLDSRHWLVVRSRPLGQGQQARHAGAAAPAPPPWQPDTAPGVPRGASRLAPLLPGADLLWALEQALKSGQVGAVLAWLPVNLRADALRRLQLAAQAQAGPVFLFRDALARGRPSPAPLRLLLQPAGADALALRILKRRGPLLAQPLKLALPPVLPPAVQARLQAEAQAQGLRQALAAGR
jgi:protein ImuA